MSTAIAILGWGSLLWDKRPDFDSHHFEWMPQGPELPLEFARISKTRAGALTLVLDYEHGTPCTVAYTRSKRSDPDDAICDLLSREGSSRKHIGYLHANGSLHQAKDNAALESISAWAKANNIDFVVWTDLPRNFEIVTGKSFSVQSALDYIAELPSTGKAAAAEYIWRAPALVATPVRSALQSQLWFPPPQ